MQRLICFFRSACKLISQWICSQNQPICQPALLSNAIRRRLKSQCFCMFIVGFFFLFFKDNVNEWVTFACDGTGPADESKRTKRVQGCSRLNWLGGILIIVSWHIHFNKLLMPLAPVCYFANLVQGLQRVFSLKFALKRFRLGLVSLFVFFHFIFDNIFRQSV